MLTEEQNNIRCERLAKANEDAQYAFWEEFAKHYPESKSGDLDPLYVEEFDRACQIVTAEWVDNNVPEWQEDYE